MQTANARTVIFSYVDFLYADFCCADFSDTVIFPTGDFALAVIPPASVAVFPNEGLSMPMSDSPNDWSIEQQTVEDLITGLTFEFKLGSDGVPVLRVTGDGVPGAREIRFPQAAHPRVQPRDSFPAATHVN
jgi:hypothetical protein